MQAIDRSPFDPNVDRLITIGDYLDGGWHIEIMPTIEYLNQLPNWIGLVGTTTIGCTMRFKEDH